MRGLAALTLAIAAPDEDLLGKAEGYPIGSRADWCFNEQVRVGWFSNLDHALHARKGNILGSLAALGSGSVGYRFEQQSYTIEDFLARERVTGLLLIKDGQILIER
jgi:hypothetical protein